MARHKMYVSSAKAEQELGYRPGRVESALERAVEWFRNNGGRIGFADMTAPHAGMVAAFQWEVRPLLRSQSRAEQSPSFQAVEFQALLYDAQRRTCCFGHCRALERKILFGRLTTWRNTSLFAGLATLGFAGGLVSWS